MFYNYCRSTKASLIDKEQRKAKRKQISMSHSPTQRVLNLQKRQKLKNLLMMKFMEKYNLNYPDHTIENEVTKFVQGEKLTDMDLQRLNNKIQRLIRNSSARNLLEKTMNKQLTNPLNLNEKKNYQTIVTNDKIFSPKLKKDEDNYTDMNNLNNNLYPRNDVFSLPKVNGNPILKLPRIPCLSFNEQGTIYSSIFSNSLVIK